MFAATEQLATTLPSLPPDIIRIIVRMSKQPMDSLRLVAPIWNSIVVEYLTDRRNYLPLGLLQFDHFDSTEDVKITIETDHQLPYPNSLFRGWISQVPRRFKLSIKSPPLRVRTLQFTDVRWQVIASVVVLIIAFIVQRFLLNDQSSTDPIIFMLSLSMFLLILAIISLTGYHAYLRMFIKPKVIETLDRISLLASRCSYIEYLAFYYIEEETLEILRNGLDHVKVKWLWIIEKRLIEQTRHNIIKLIQLNSVQLLTLHFMYLDENDLRELFAIAAQAAIYIEVLENKHTSTTGMVFGRSIDFWAEMERELYNESVHIHVFDHLAYAEWHYRIKILSTKFLPCHCSKRN